MQKSQISPTECIHSKLEQWGFKSIVSVKDVLNLHRRLHAELRIIPYTDGVRDAEKAIRWKRTGSQVLEDGYVYEGKACTDYVVAFLALLHSAGITNTSFIKLKHKDTDMVHSVCEFQIEGEWYVFNAGVKNPEPQKGTLQVGDTYGNYTVWKKGRDSWDLGLDSYNKITTIR